MPLQFTLQPISIWVVRHDLMLGSASRQRNDYLYVYYPQLTDAERVDFLPVLLGLAGITDRNRQRQLNLVNSCTSMLGALTGSAIVDHVGRRKLLLTGITCAAVGMCIVGFLLSPIGEESKTRADAGISFICESLYFSTLCTRLIHSPIHGQLLFRLDAASRSLPS